MKRIMLSLLGLIACVKLLAEAHVDPETGDIRIWIQSGSSERDREQLEKQRERDKVYEGLNMPYSGSSFEFRHSTIGWLCKESHLIVRGRIESVTEKNINVLINKEKGIYALSPVAETVFHVSETLAGKAQTDKITLALGSSLNLEIGAEVLLFLSDKRYDLASNRIYPGEWQFDRANAKILKTIPLQLTKGRSMIALEKDTREAILTSVKEYLRLQSSKDADAYRAFLSQQIKSPVPRLSDDALWDMIWFVRSYSNNDKEELRKTSQDTDLEERVKGYLRYLLRDENEKPKEE